MELERSISLLRQDPTLELSAEMAQSFTFLATVEHEEGNPGAAVKTCLAACERYAATLGSSHRHAAGYAAVLDVLWRAFTALGESSTPSALCALEQLACLPSSPAAGVAADPRGVARDELQRRQSFRRQHRPS